MARAITPEEHELALKMLEKARAAMRDDLASLARRSERLVLREPLGKRAAVEGGQGELRRDPGHLFGDFAEQPAFVDEVGDAGHGARTEAADDAGLAEDAIDEWNAVAPRALRLLARHEPRKIDELTGPLVLGIGALDVAELALPAEVAGAREVGVRKMLGSLGASLVDVPIDGVEDRGERAAITDAHAAFVADLEDALELRLEIDGIPVTRIVGALRGGNGGASRKMGHGTDRPRRARGGGVPPRDGHANHPSVS